MTRRLQIAVVLVWITSFLALTGVTTPVAHSAVAAQQSTNQAGDAETPRPMTDPAVSPEGTLQDAIAYASTHDADFGPEPFSTDLTVDNNQYKGVGVKLQDFVAEMTYVTPLTDPAGDKWFGVGFWAQGPDGAAEFYDVFLEQLGDGRVKWGLGHDTMSHEYAILQSGDLAAESTDLTPGATNQLTIVVYHGYALLSGNTGRLDTSVTQVGTPQAGDVMVETGLYADDQTSSQTLPVEIKSFAVWDLSTAMVGDIPQQGSTEQTSVSGTSTGESTSALPTTAENAGMLRSIADPNVDPAGTLHDAIALSRTEAPTAGPFHATLELDRWAMHHLPTDVRLQDFIVQMTYTTPMKDPRAAWGFGVCFWTNPVGNCSALSVHFDDQSDPYGGPEIFNGDASTAPPPSWSALSGGSMDITPGSQNTLTIVVYHGIGIISGNSGAVELAIPVPGTPLTGDVQAQVAAVAWDQNESRTLSMTIESFAIWDLSSGMVSGNPSATPPQELPVPTNFPAPYASAPSPSDPTVAATQTPANAAATPGVLDLVFDHERTAALAQAPIASSGPGTLTQSKERVYIVQTTNISIADFYATATFVNPADMSNPTDIGMAFRDALWKREFRFIVNSQGRWWVSIGDDPVIVSGDLDNFDASPRGINTIEIIAYGASGLVEVNGRVVAELDLSAVSDNGAVQIGSGWYPSNAIEGRETLYQDFKVYQLPA